MAGYMREAICGAKNPLALTGAGISAPSGIPTFQSRWKGRPVRDFLSRLYRENDPVGFFELFCAMEAWCGAAPNGAHLALAEAGIPVITQNIDGLHQKAGSRLVLELHGGLRMVCCLQCGKQMAAGEFCNRLRPLYQANDRQEIIKHLACGCGGYWDTDVVLYGDSVRGLDQAYDLLEACDVLLVIGTSLETYPAALMPQIARQNGARVLVENDDCILALTGKRGL